MVASSDGEEAVRKFLADLNLEQYFEKLIDEGYDDMRSIKELTEEDLTEVGCKKGHVKRFLAAVAEEKERYKQGQQSGAASKAGTDTAPGTPASPAPPAAAPTVPPTPPDAAPMTPPSVLVTPPTEPIRELAPTFGFDVQCVTLPDKFEKVFRDLLKMGCYCWRIVDEVTDKGKKNERVLAVARNFLFLTHLTGRVITAVRIEDIHTVFMQDKAAGGGTTVTSMAVKPTPAANELTLVLQLRHDKRNPTNDPKHPLAVFNHLCNGKKRPAPTMVQVDKNADLHKLPNIGHVQPPPNYLDPITKLTKWRETGVWPTADSASASQRKVELPVTATQAFAVGKDVKGSRRLSWWANGRCEIEAVDKVGWDAEKKQIAVTGKDGRVLTADIERGQQRSLLHNMQKILKYARVKYEGSPLVPVGEQKMRQMSLQEVTFVDAEGDTTVFRITQDKTLELQANSDMTITDLTRIGHKDDTLTFVSPKTGTLELSIVQPAAGTKRQAALWQLGQLCKVAGVQTDGMPEEKPSTQGSITSPTAIPGTPRSTSDSWRHDPYGEGDDGSMSGISFTNSTFNTRGQYQYTGSVHSDLNVSSPYAMPHTASTCADSEAPPTLLSTCSEFQQHGGTAGSVTYPAGPPPADPNSMPYPPGGAGIPMQQGGYHSPQQAVAGMAPPSPQGWASGGQATLPYVIQLQQRGEPLGFEYGAIPNALIITSVDPQRASGRAGIPAHTQILSLNGQHIACEADLLRAVRGARDAGLLSIPIEVIAKHGQYSPPPPIHIGQPQSSPVNSPSNSPSNLDCVRLAVMFKHGRRGEYMFDQRLEPGAYVLIETSDGADVGLVIGSRQGGKKGDRFRARRLAEPQEVEAWKALVPEEQEALEYMRQRAVSHGTPLQLHRAEYQFQRKKLTLHYTADVQHPNFQQLVHDGYQRFGCRIWMNNCVPGAHRGEPIDLTSSVIPTL